MSKSKKKKKSLNKIKAEKAIHKKEYFEKFEQLLNSITGEDTFSELSDLKKKLIYKYRVHSPSFETAKDCEAPGWLVENFRWVLMKLLKTKCEKLNILNLEITQYDFLTILYDVCILLNKESEMKFNREILDNLNKEIENGNHEFLGKY